MTRWLYSTNTKDIIYDNINPYNIFTDKSWRIDHIFPSIDMTNLTHSLAVVNISGCVIIFLCLTTILSAFYGNKIIQSFDLENKYPSLAIFIKLRIKFQNYTIVYNFILLSVVLFLITITNILVLFN